MRRLILSVLVGASICVFCVACGPASPFAPQDDNNGPDPLRLDFQMPADGSTVASVQTLRVSGAALVRVLFAVDDTAVAEDVVAPFEWTFDPADFVLGRRKLSVIGFTSSGASDSATRTVTLQRAVPLSEIVDAIENLPPSHWYEIPNSRLRAVGYSNPVDNRGDLANIMRAVSGAAYDTKRNRLVVFGGGGVGYNGNEVYVFDMNTLEWSRLNDPSAFDPADPDNLSFAKVHPDGSPIARHTYDYLEYIPPPIDRLFCGTGVALFPTPNGDDRAWFFDFDTLGWEIVAETTDSGGAGATAAVAPDGRVWQQGGSKSNQPISAFDPITKTWQRFAAFPTFFGPQSVSEIDPVDNKMYAVGDGQTVVWDLSQPSELPTVLASSGDRDIETAAAPGVAYHPGTGRIVSWAGGANVYSLDPATSTWTRHVSTGPVDPGPQTSRGTFGRFRYVEFLDVFVMVSEVDNNVFVYRLPDTN